MQVLSAIDHLNSAPTAEILSLLPWTFVRYNQVPSCTVMSKLMHRAGIQSPLLRILLKKTQTPSSADFWNVSSAAEICSTLLSILIGYNLVRDESRSKVQVCHQTTPHLTLPSHCLHLCMFLFRRRPDSQSLGGTVGSCHHHA